MWSTNVPAFQVLAITGVFGAVALLVGLATDRMLSALGPERRRLKQSAQVPATGVLIDTTALTPEESRFVKRVTAIVPRSPKQMTVVRRRFARAGYYTLTPIAAFTLAQIILPVVFGLAPLYFGPTGVQAVIFVMIGAMLGLQIPTFWLYRKTSIRQQQIQNGLPDLLDLLIVC